MIPSGGQAFAGDADFLGFVALEQVQAQAAQPGEVLGSVPLADAALVFPKADVELPVQAVLDSPVAPHVSGHPLGIRSLEAADIEASLHTFLLPDRTRDRSIIGYIRGFQNSTRWSIT